MIFTFLVRKYRLAIFVPLFFILTFLANPALAHHPFGMGDSSELSAWQALLSGIGHPLLDLIIYFLC